MGVVGGPDANTDQLDFYIDPANPNSYTSGSSTAVNMVGNYNGTISGATFLTSSVSQGVWNLDNDDSIRFDSVQDLGISSSIEMWVKRNDVSGTEFWIGGEGTGFPTSYQYIFATVNTTDFYVRFGAAWKLYANSIWNSTTEWRHVVLSRDGVNSGKLYVNGNEIAVTGTSSTWGGNTLVRSIGVGADLGNNPSYANIQLGPVLFYKKTLSPAEVLDNYNLSKWRFV